MVCEARLMRLAKMHGARNDFVIADLRRERVEDVISFARWVCDRRAGIGADGLILLEPSNAGAVRMRTINADGSEAEMCGNGVRCAARWLDEAGEGGEIAFETAAGMVGTEVVARVPEYLVRVAMGRPKIGGVALPPSLAANYVELGNPHVVIFTENFEAIDLASVAQRVAHALPGGANVHAAAVRGQHAIEVRHWERGVGPTMACGTGAVACAAVAVDRELVAAPVEVFVPGGRLIVEFDAQGNASLTGPARRVFDVEVDVDDGAMR
jgi:diaminopimelate epimerase